MHDTRIERLGEALVDAIDEFCETEQMTVGEVMTTLFALFVAAAKSGGGYDPVRLKSEVNERMAEVLQ